MSEILFAGHSGLYRCESLVVSFDVAKVNATVDLKSFRYRDVN